MRSSGDIDANEIPEIAFTRLPVATEVFSARAARFRFLSSGHAISDYLAALALLVDAQIAALAGIRLDPGGITLQQEFPLCAGTWHRDETWRRALSVIISELEQAPLPYQSRHALKLLSERSPQELESIADAMLAGDCAALDLASAPFVGAALQTYWTALAGLASGKGAAPGRQVCPVCASPPIAGIVLGNRKLRYLVCGLCATEWYVPRLICTGCGSTAGISYLSVEGEMNGVKAESCAQCSTYLKLFYLEADPAVEPFADDAATLSLDLLMSAEGFSRTGLNLFLLPGSGS